MIFFNRWKVIFMFAYVVFCKIFVLYSFSAFPRALPTFSTLHCKSTRFTAKYIQNEMAFQIKKFVIIWCILQ